MARGRVYARGSTLWLDYTDDAGKRRRQSTGLRVGQERQAQAVLRALLARLEASDDLGGGEITVQRWAEEWIGRRERRGVAMARDERQRLRTHIGPALGDVPLADLSRRQVVRWVDGLRERLAPRSVLHVYGTLRQMMTAAVREELIPASPCTLAGDELPRLEDRDPEWRQGAIYTREEIEILISHPDIPEERRLGYALMALGGLRWGEVAALRWRAYDASAEPLGRLTVSAALSDRRRSLARKAGELDADGIGRTKTGAVRQVPVHPTLAAMLAAWKLRRGGGRDDLIIPGYQGRPITQPRAYERLRADLEILGMEPRRLHDFRRTMISLAQADGAQPGTLRWITHTPSKADMIVSYTSLPWATLCEAVECLRIGIRQGEVVEMQAAAGAQSGHSSAGGKGKAPESLTNPGPALVGDAGFESASRRSANVGRCGVSADFHARKRVTGDFTPRPESAESGEGCAKCAPGDPEAAVRAALAGLDPADARALLVRVLADLA